MSQFARESRELEREVAMRREWIEDILRLEAEQQRHLYELVDAAVADLPQISEVGEQSLVPVEGGEIRVYHLPPALAATGTRRAANDDTGSSHSQRPREPKSARPVLFVPGWGAIPQEFQEFYEFLGDEVELYYLETREKRSSLLRGKNPPMSVEQSARDVATAIRHLGLEGSDFVLIEIGSASCRERVCHRV